MVHLLGPLSGDSQLSLRFQANQCQVSDHHYERYDDENDHKDNHDVDDSDDDEHEGVE